MMQKKGPLVSADEWAKFERVFPRDSEPRAVFRFDRRVYQRGDLPAFVLLPTEEA